MEVWITVAGVVSGAVSWALAAVIYASRPDRRQNRVLAAFLTLTGSAWMVSRASLPWLDAAAAAYAMWVMYFIVHTASHIFHLRFQATLDSPLAALIRRWPGKLMQLVLVAMCLLFVVRPDLLWAGVAPNAAGAPWTIVPAPQIAIWSIVYQLLWAFGVAVGISVYLRGGGRRARPSIKAYARGFVVHDLGFVVFLLLQGTAWPGFSAEAAANTLLLTPPILNLWLVAWLSYGILHDQLFDIDLKVKFGISRGTVAAIIAGAALIGGELLERLVGADALWASVAVGATTALAFRPLARFGERLADRALPGVEDTDEYRGRRSEELYRSAWESALLDGEVTAKERDVLATLASSLRLTKTDVRRLESTKP